MPEQGTGVPSALTGRSGHGRLGGGRRPTGATPPVTEETWPAVNFDRRRRKFTKNKPKNRGFSRPKIDDARRRPPRTRAWKEREGRGEKEKNLPRPLGTSSERKHGENPTVPAALLRENRREKEGKRVDGSILKRGGLLIGTPRTLRGLRSSILALI